MIKVKDILKKEFMTGRTNKGFTLIELLVVVAIIGILAAIGVATFGGFQGASKANATKANHKEFINYASSLLMKCHMGETKIDLMVHPQSLPQSYNCADSLGNFLGLFQTHLWNYKKILYFWSPESIGIATRGIINSFILAFSGATIAMIFAILISYMIHRTKGFGATALDFLCVIPIGFPGIVLAMGVLVTYIKTPIYATLGILLVGYITRFFPYGQRNISSIMLAISEELDQSSRMAGASWLTTLRRITIPLLKPGIFSRWILLFVID